MARRIQRTRDGEFRIRLSSDERALLRALTGQLRELLGTDDPSLRRLTPPGYADDPKLEAEYRELVGDDLAAQRLRALDVMESTADADRLGEEELAAWLGAVNDLRLVLGTRLDVTEDLYTDGIAEDDPRAPSLGVYVYLGWLEEQIVEALASGLRSG